MAVTLELTQIPDEIAAGASVTIVPDVAKNTSEGGISGRKQMRSQLRNYIITVSPEHSDEMQEIAMTAGTRYPMAIRDPVNNTIEGAPALISEDGVTAKIQRTWSPSTGNLTAVSRVLLPIEATVVIRKNGFVVTSGEAILGNYGIITFSPPLDPETDDVTVDCEFLTACCCLDAPSAVAFAPGQYQFTDFRLEEIFEAELVKLLT